MNARFSTLLATLGFLWCSLSAQAGVSIQGSRVIYKEANGEATVLLQSVNQTPSLVQVWVDDGDPEAPVETLAVPFTVIPAVVRLDPNRGQSIRILRTGGNFPADRESLYWFNVYEIPSTALAAPGAEDRLQFTGRARLKLLYRPKGLSMPPEKAHESLQFSLASQTPDGRLQLRVRNGSPYHVTFRYLGLRRPGDAEDAPALALFDASTLQERMVPPLGELIMPLEINPAAGNAMWTSTEVAYGVINDYGGTSAGSQRLSSSSAQGWSGQ